MNKTGGRHNNGVAGNRAAGYDSSWEDGNPVVCDGWLEGAEPEGVVVVLVGAAVAVVAAAGVVAVVLAVADVQAAPPDVAVVAVVVVAVDVVAVWFEPKQTNRGST